MNYLAHMLLSGNDEKVMLGNFVADWVKGNSYTQFPLRVQQGILMHRAIDSFTDQHKLHKHSRTFFAPYYGRFSGIVVDVLYDHFLSQHWAEFCKTSRRDFIAEAYSVMNTYRQLLPPRPRRLLPSIIYHDWVGAYVSFAGLEKVLERMSKRSPLPAMSNAAISVLRDNYQQIDTDFCEFFPLLKSHVSEVSPHLIVTGKQ